MPSESLIAVDGYLRTLPDGSLVTDANGAPCCCGGGPIGCCICIDTGASPDEPCFYDYANDKAEVLCNPVPKCCCGQRLRVTFRRSGIYTGTTNGAIEDVTLDDMYVFESFIKEDNNGKCIGAFIDVSYHYEYHRMFTKKNGEKTYTDMIDDDLSHGSHRFFPYMLRPFLMCRPEPAAVSEVILFQGTGPNEPEKLFNPYDPSIYAVRWFNVFNKYGCSGQVLYDNGYVYGLTKWHSSSGCRTATISATGETRNVTADAASWSQTGTLTAKVLDNKCCPPVFSSAFQPTGPVNPADPGNPGGLGCGGCQDGGAALGAEL